MPVSASSSRRAEAIVLRNAYCVLRSRSDATRITHHASRITSSMAQIVVIGSLNMDLVVRTPRFPQPGETLLGQTFQTIPGGKGANQAVAAVRLGARVTLAGRVGADAFGERLR